MNMTDATQIAVGLSLVRVAPVNRAPYSRRVLEEWVGPSLHTIV